MNTVSPQIFLYPSKDLVMYPGDVIGFRYVFILNNAMIIFTNII